MHDGHGDVVSVIHDVSNRPHFNVHTHARAPLAVSPRRAQPPRLAQRWERQRPAQESSLAQKSFPLAPPSYLAQEPRTRPVREPPATAAPPAGGPPPTENKSRHPGLDGWPLDVLSRLIARDPQDIILIAPDHLAPADLVDRLDDALKSAAAHPGPACVLHRCRSLADLRARAAKHHRTGREESLDGGPAPVR